MKWLAALGIPAGILIIISDIFNWPQDTRQDVADLANQLLISVGADPTATVANSTAQAPDYTGAIVWLIVGILLLAAGSFAAVLESRAHRRTHPRP